MRFSTVAILLLLLGLTSGLTAKAATAQSLYSKIARTCGPDQGQPSYASSEYSLAFARAAADRAAAVKGKQTSVVQQIDLKTKRLKECEAIDAAKLKLLPYRDCNQFVAQAEEFASWSTQGIAGGYITPSQVDDVKKRLAEDAQKCIDDQLKSCIDPLDTQAVMTAVRAVNAASAFLRIGSFKDQRGIERILTMNNPFTKRLKFCTTTTFACGGGTEFCRNRESEIKNAFQAMFD